MHDKSNPRTVVGVCGGISAYKSPDLVRRLRQNGHPVQVVMSREAEHFITSLTLQAVSGQPVRTDLLDPRAEAAMGHIELARWAELVLIAPATAHFLAKLRHGLADDLLSTLCLATRAPIAVAPAMNREMWLNRATRDNVAALAGRGVVVLGPGEGDQACGETGPGRMLEPRTIASRVRSLLAGRDALGGVGVLVTAGPTREPLDPVRFISNHSSGRMGYALAEAARAAGAGRVLLVSGPTTLDPPAGVELSAVRGAGEMHERVVRLAFDGDVDAVVMAAAVADYTPAEGARPAKIRKSDGELALRLRRTPDVLADLGARRGDADRPVLVGFAAETGDAVERAREKLVRKRVDLVVANDVTEPGAGFAGDTNVATLVSAAGAEPIPRRSKRDLARVILDWVDARLGASRPAAKS